VVVKAFSLELILLLDTTTVILRERLFERKLGIPQQRTFSFLVTDLALSKRKAKTYYLGNQGARQLI